MFWTRRGNHGTGSKMNTKFWAGIGSRSTPTHVLRVMASLANEINQLGYWLRSGNAEGSDQAFAKGVIDEKAQIWLPWDSFNVDFQILHPNHTYKTISPIDKESFESIMKFHPNPKRLGNQGTLLMARNYRQIVGKDEPNSQFVVCWTPDGKKVGGTAQAWRIADWYDIPVYNLYDLTKDEIIKEIEKLNLLQ
jgi:hypothetical protein